jgi:hypothetical protein
MLKKSLVAAAMAAVISAPAFATDATTSATTSTTDTATTQQASPSTPAAKKVEHKKIATHHKAERKFKHQEALESKKTEDSTKDSI